MLITVHLLLGILIGKSIESLWLIIPIAILSHYLLDMIPHTPMPTQESFRDKGIKGVSKKLLLLESIEPILGIALAFFIIFTLSESHTTLIIGAFFAWFPDIITFIVWKKRWTWADPYLPRPGSRWYNKSKSKITGILTQIITAIIIIFLIFK